MGLLNPSKGVVDFDEWRALQSFYEMARKAGLWVVLRPGARVLTYIRCSLTNTSHRSRMSLILPVFPPTLNSPPSQYINAETSAGGIAHWATSEVAGTLRTNASDWKEAWKPYVQGIIDETVGWQVSEGGPVIAIQIGGISIRCFLFSPRRATMRFFQYNLPVSLPPLFPLNGAHLPRLPTQTTNMNKKMVPLTSKILKIFIMTRAKSTCP
jgi:hypothetical protein